VLVFEHLKEVLPREKLKDKADMFFIGKGLNEVNNKANRSLV
jgi:hypothetical protein